jgi:beta-lactamase superfamily II metal-dependent hydrolase
MYNIQLLPASFGDSLLISYGSANKPTYILIDGGPVNNYEEFNRALKEVAPDMEEIELLIITHIDIDHIDGIVKMLNVDEPDYKIKQIWFNGRDQLLKAADKLDELGALQGEYLTQLIEKHKIPHNKKFTDGIVALEGTGQLKEIVTSGGMKITLLAPGLAELKKLLPKWDDEMADKGDALVEDDQRYARDILGDWIEDEAENPDGSDSSLPNKSSIAFIAEYDGRTCLFAGDTPGKILEVGIDACLAQTGEAVLKLDAWKLAHHGSKGSTNSAVINKIKADHILISTDGKRYYHPDKGPLAKIIYNKDEAHSLHLHFNYRTEFNEMWDDDDQMQSYNYNVHYGDVNGIGVEL